MIEKPELGVTDRTEAGTILLACAMVGLLLFAFWVGTGIGTDIGQAIFESKG